MRFALGWVTIALITTGCTVQDWLVTPDNPKADPTAFTLVTAVGFINHVIDYLGAFSGLVTIFVIVAGYQSLLSAGSDEATQRAKDTIKYSALGMVFLVFGYAFVKLLFALLAKGNSPLSVN